MKKKKRKGKYCKSLIAFLTGMCLLSGCGGSDKSSSASAEYASADYGWDIAAEEDSKEVAESTTASGSEEGAGNTENALTENDLSNRKLIKNVYLSFETEEFDSMKENLEQSIASYGGYVEYSDFSAPQGGYRLRYYSITARIPADKLDEFVETAGNLGTLTNKSENLEDVTLAYVDKTAYRDSLKVEYERVMELLEKATDLDQILALESKLSNLRYEINSYESQIRTYDNLISYSTVNININEVKQVTETSTSVGSRIRSGFTASLTSIKEFFVELFIFVVSNLPVLLLWALVIVIVVILVRKIAAKRKNGEEKTKKRIHFSKKSKKEEDSE